VGNHNERSIIASTMPKKLPKIKLSILKRAPTPKKLNLSFLNRSSTPQKLSLATFNKEWDEAKAIVKTEKGKKACSKYTMNCSFHGVKSDILPLHEAVSIQNVPIEFVQNLVNAYPAAVKKTESAYQRIALHIAIKSRTSDDIIIFLLKSYPEGAKVKDIFGRIPLHYAMSNHASTTIVHSLIADFPTTTSAVDNDSRTALHVATLTAAPAEIVRILATNGPEALYMKTLKGRTPAQCVKVSKNSNRDEILKILMEAEKKHERNPIFSNLEKSEIRGKPVYLSNSNTEKKDEGRKIMKQLSFRENNYDEYELVRKQLSSETSSLV